MQSTIVVLAAGIASRYGSMKKTQSFGPSGETIMEYSIYDAINAGFERVVFIIREDFADIFKNLMPTFDAPTHPIPAHQARRAVRRARSS